MTESWASAARVRGGKSRDPPGFLNLVFLGIFLLFFGLFSVAPPPPPRAAIFFSVVPPPGNFSADALGQSAIET